VGGGVYSGDKRNVTYKIIVSTLHWTLTVLDGANVVTTGSNLFRGTFPCHHVLLWVETQNLAAFPKDHESELARMCNSSKENNN
jgi:hypothetical protein